MSDTAVREAAERLRRFAETEQVTNPLSLLDDMRLCSNAYLAEHPPDDSELISEEWLRSVGAKEKQYQGNKVLSFRIKKAVDAQWIETTEDSVSHRGSFVMCRWSPLYDDDTPPDRVEIYLPNRGSFRSFAALVGIPLKETQVSQ